MIYLFKIGWTLLALPFIIVGGVLFGLLRLVLTPLELVCYVLASIWEDE